VTQFCFGFSIKLSIGSYKNAGKFEPFFRNQTELFELGLLLSREQPRGIKTQGLDWCCIANLYQRSFHKRIQEAETAFTNLGFRMAKAI